jgi:uncharacterized membrane protein YgcG
MIRISAKKGKKMKGMYFRRCLRTASAVIFSVILIMSVIAASAGRAAADGIDTAFTTNSYDVRIDVNKDDSYDVTEKIKVDFNEYRHGIYRYIPMSREYIISDISVPSDDFSVNTYGGNRVIIIGSDSRTITGRKSYTIKYKIRYLKEHESSCDIMNIDVLPASWRTSISSASVVINVPNDMNWKKISTYSGQYGSMSDSYGTWQISEKNHRISYHAENLPDHTGATVRAVLPDGYWEGAPLFKISDLIIILVLAAAAVAIFILRRSTRGEHVDVVETVEFYPPDDMTPVEIGYIIDDTVNEDDITAMLFFLAQKGVIKIEPMGDKDYKFTKLAEPGPGRYEQMYFRALFGKSSDQVKIGSWTRLSTAKKKIGKYYDQIREDVSDEFKGEKAMFSSRSKLVSMISYAIFFVASFIVSYRAAGFSGITESNDPSCFMTALVVAVILAAFLASAGNSIENRRIESTAGLIISTVIFFVIYGAAAVFDLYALSKGEGIAVLAACTAFYILAPFLVIGEKKRTRWGAEIYGRAIGFRSFIEAAEAPKIQTLLEEDPDYCSDMLPYAYAFGLIKKWQNLFEELDIDSPDWCTASAYAGIISLASTMDSIGNDIGSEVHETSSSFDSGGGSGGGGGGGGGGSW